MSTATAQMQGELRAAVDTAAVVPRLVLNGQLVPPLMFFANNHVPGEQSERAMREQVALARDAGVHLYSFTFYVPHRGGEPDYTALETDLQIITGIDPQARCLVRMYPGPYDNWDVWPSIEAEHTARYADGSEGRVSIGSPYFCEASNEDNRRTIERFEASRFGGHIYAYQLGGPDSENFMADYREKGPDIGPANTLGFRQWLTETYGSDAALRNAWGREDVSLSTAAVPRDAERFPMRGANENEVARIFYELPKEQDWVDYSLYCSDIMADRIIDWAGLIKKTTGGRKLAAFFYGYFFDLNGSISGHNQLARVLQCPDVDILASPYSYEGRQSGAPGSFMSPVDSVVAHGKLWFNEDDTRTSVVDPANLVPPFDSLWRNQIETLDKTLDILERNLHSTLIHRAGIWWMDLVGGGMFNHPALWNRMQLRAPLFEQRALHPSPYRPNVAVLVDERSEAVVKSDWDATFRYLAPVRNNSECTGASVGFYLLSDFIEGLVPQYHAYVFANSFVLSQKQRLAIRSRLDADSATAIWMYAPGCFGPAGFEASRAESTCGIHLRAENGRQRSSGEHWLDEMEWGWDHEVDPRTIVADTDALPLGRYLSDGEVSAAVKNVGNHTSVFLGDFSPSPDVLRALFAQAGAHIWTDGREVVRADDRFLSIHRAYAGTAHISIPEGIQAQRAGGPVYTGTAAVPFEQDETILFLLSQAAELSGNAVPGGKHSPADSCPLHRQQAPRNPLPGEG